jgi:DNA-binding GntR family transcriptional regulator
MISKGFAMAADDGRNSAVPRIARLARETLHDRAYDEIKKAIMSGAIMPGSTITIRALAAALGTSPMPVRDALSRLVAERALELLPTRSVSLPVMTVEKFSEIATLRVAIEGLVAEAGTGRLAPSALIAMTQLNEEMTRPKIRRSPAYLAKNQEFHFALYQAAEMPVAMAIIESLWLQTGPLLNHVMNEHGFQAASDHHGAALAALKRRDGAGVRRAIQEDITEAAQTILAILAREDASPRREASIGPA